jgi:uncharacterized membrane protein
MNEEEVHDYTAHQNVGMIERAASVTAGAALLGVAAKRVNPAVTLLSSLAGFTLVYRGATGHCPFYATIGVSTAAESDADRSTSVAYGHGIRVEQAVTIQKPVDELFRFWRKIENLPLFMDHLEKVEAIDDKRSHWTAVGPAGSRIEWDAEIINEVENELIGWRSLEGADVDHAGSVHFKPLPADRGTEVRVILRYDPPAGKLGSLVARLFAEEPSQQVSSDLRRLRQILESGEEPSVEGQPRGG